MHKFTNALAQETSPYLLQHAHNPVNWVPWSEEAFETAKRENKMVLVSVGYSACHWCHVMEHESFENEEVATLMNKHFVCIKVDREERPDVDQVYMTAVQIMTQRGGWPLNCFTLPDGRPVYGGTYFPKEQWMHILRSLEHTFKNDYEKVVEYATNLHDGIIQSELIAEPAKDIIFEEEKVHEMVTRWAKGFDNLEGGNAKAPKFPLPSNYQFLMHYGTFFENQRVLNHVELTLDKMAYGGIYDQVGGGFTRYSVDMLWKVPHFEKMLYDNGQLLSLYAEGYKKFNKLLYKRIVFQTVEWLTREMSHPEGAFYAALDADSEGEEGKFYCWNEDELKAILDKDYAWVKEFYSVNARGYWEDEKFIPLRVESDVAFAKKQNWTLDELEKNIQRINERLLTARSKRIRPGLDDKCLTSWNALLLKGLCDSYKAFGEDEFLLLALKVGKWIRNYQMQSNGALFRNRKNGKSTIDGFLEDYATTIDGFIALYEVTFDDSWLENAKQLLEYAKKHFQNTSSKLFYFTSDSTELIARKMELNDNVIPASNSIMALNLWKMSHFYFNESWKEESRQMLMNIYDGMEMYGSGYSNWGSLLMHNLKNYYEVVFSGKHDANRTELYSKYLPNVVFANSANELPISEGKVSENSAIFVCFEGTCLRPVETATEASIELMKR